MKRLGLLVAAVLALVAPNAVRADITFQFVTDQTSYSAAAGQPVSVNVYLQETDTNGSPSLSQAVAGISSYGIYATQTGGPSSGQSTIQNYTTVSAFNNLVSQSSTGSLPPNSIDFSGAQPVGTTSGEKLSAVNGQSGVYRLLLGTLTINAGASTTFTLTSMNNNNPAYLDPGDSVNAQSDDTYTLPAANNYDLDAGGTQSGNQGTFTFNGTNSEVYTFTVATPEPGGMVLSGVAACGMLIGLGYAGFRRRKALLRGNAAA